MKILIVDDNPMMRRLYKREFKLSNYDVIMVDDEAFVLETSLVEKPDIILMEIMMPKLNGLEALRVLKQDANTKDIPVIILSGYEEESMLQEALDLGVKRYLIKSNNDPSFIVATVNEVIAEEHPIAA